MAYSSTSSMKAKPAIALVILLVLILSFRNLNTPLKYPGSNITYNTVRQDENNQIRQWGCNRSETPLIFVHVGKSGGGNIRARFAASARNFTRPKNEWGNSAKDGSFYPVFVGSKEMSMGRGTFCNSGHKAYKVSKLGTFYESFSLCNATTPIGLLGCPEHLNHAVNSCDAHNKCGPSSDSCHTVYVGHNMLGNELHWLPHKYLGKWWNSTYWGQKQESIFISNYIDTLGRWNKNWCPEANHSRPTTNLQYEALYDKCQLHHSKRLDSMANELFQVSLEENQNANFGAIYASMPVLRTVMVRDPFSWLISKFFWHEIDGVCDDTEIMTRNNGTSYMSHHRNGGEGIGWGHQYAMLYLTHLCGNDCYLNALRGISTIQQMEQQAETNLRRSFAVVGILEHGEEEFFDMINSRVQYVDMSLNPHVQGDAHKSGGGNEKKRCKRVFQNVTMQQKLIDKSPAISAIVRLYQVAKDVNEFQRKELDSCS